MLLKLTGYCKAHVLGLHLQPREPARSGQREAGPCRSAPVPEVLSVSSPVRASIPGENGKEAEAGKLQMLQAVELSEGLGKTRNPFEYEVEGLQLLQVADLIRQGPQPLHAEPESLQLRQSEESGRELEESVANQGQLAQAMETPQGW